MATCPFRCCAPSCSKAYVASKRIFNGNQTSLFIRNRFTRPRFGKQRKYWRIFYRSYSVIIHRCRWRVHPSVLFATTALVLLASSLARTGQRPYLSYLSCSVVVASFSVSFTLLSLSPTNLRSSSQLSLIRCTGKLT